MEDYGQVYGEDFGAEFFTQEYWYLFIAALARFWRGAPLNVGEACRIMRTGSAKTRETRLKRLIDEGWFSRRKGGADLRMTYVAPTRQLRQLGRAHLAASLARIVTRLAGGGLLAQGIGTVLEGRFASSQDVPPLLVAWAEFLVEYTNDWNATFRNRFHTEEYWYPFVHCLRGQWAGTPLTMSAACDAMPTGSHRTRETRIAIAESRGMLEKRKSTNDLRNTLILPTPALERAVVGHFSRTLAELLCMLRNNGSATSRPSERARVPAATSQMTR